MTVVRLNRQQWRAGPSAAFLERRRLLDLGYRLFSDLAGTRLRQEQLLDELCELPLLPERPKRS